MVFVLGRKDFQDPFECAPLAMRRKDIGPIAVENRLPGLQITLSAVFRSEECDISRNELRTSHDFFVQPLLEKVTERHWDFREGVARDGDGLLYGEAHMATRDEEPR